ncbi:UDP-N-acetylmuramate:L-alanyl-gamma-D-glutamyl-meso-diaminopimelate ligase [Gammaproteobacteria bacterium]|jgi:UDP-N-acetylmuramate: L-alanyl-gamma-D-glutamyl-meso-diaminopimelate ligase|nr:UDP-N-acetylmuramate:L-alanyl-gamma-D-glutamyl-meso-diaminopimelate ligase [Gammaproteobacteria bacterium]MDA9174804.1 UDP-N-acetylmuramate:L-alanyl-gamma-D-glutamyl-meso-diaminopimelate ligase [Gammaproteobacteria bacterium]MDA9834144.1 UDP-N-acetylmuramate:L-alanyl-gamma-D-glutamyl-meso-diaminopimelate ligase [Gammaproteobacteria bacterium]MDA9979352.1 UDP-N-acetylmuramate:L-alanyl-gamma-D-glutamyl-meso-diaminopimelate ligase [Gammaproteobacteria bacterium]MDC3371759.1 UDP-N-acetylmuramate
MKIHILGICGTFMGGLAQILVEKGHQVSGSDHQFYPPMSVQLEALGVEMIQGYDTVNLPDADLFVIGNALSRGNSSVEHILNAKLPFTSGPQMLGEMIKDKTVIAVAGTHGKTSTAFMLCEIFQHQDMDIGYLVGGVSQSLELSARLGSTNLFVIEADEYDSAFFDKRSKFIHYHPDTFIINNIEFDHADIFSDLSDILKQFHHAVRTVPGEGNILIHADGDNISELLEMGCWSNTHQIGTKETIDLDLTNKILNFKEETFKLESLPFYGIHNYQNALMAIYAAFLNGVHPKDSFAALQNFQGVKRRFEKIYEDSNITIIDDFAHHPTAIESTIAAAQDHFDGNILGIIELGSNTMSGGFHGTNLHKSANSLDGTFWLNLSGSEGEGHEFTSVNALLNNLKDTLDGFDVILIMSNKDSKKISEPLIELIKKK